METRINASNILLIEDNQDDIELTQKALKKGKVLNNLYIVKDGEEALDFLSHRGKYSNAKNPLPDLILLDIKLPKVDGLEVLKHIKEARNLKRVPVIILTTSNRDKDIVSSYDLGVNSYIQKPVDFNKFINTVKDIAAYWLLTNTPPMAVSQKCL